MSTSPHTWWNLGYYGIFLWVFIEQLGAPLPAFPILMAAGALVASHELSMPSCLGTAVVAALLADSIWYAVGWVRGGSVLNLMCRVSWRPDTCVSKTKVVFFKHGTKILIFAKFIPGLSTLTPPLAGMARVPWVRFLLYDGLGAFLWALLPLVAGAYLQKSFAALAAHASMFKGYLPWLCGVIVAAVLIWRYRSRKKYRDGLAEGRKTGISIAAFRKLLDRGDDLIVLDVRDPMAAHAKPVTLPNALWIPYTVLPERLAELSLEKTVVVYCDCPSDESAVGMADFLRQRGAREVHPLLGGLTAWIEDGGLTSGLRNGVPLSGPAKRGGPKVSILLPNLNHLGFLPERLASIEAQTLQDWELVVVDGQSRDGSWEFFEAKAKEDPRMRLFSEAPRGPYAAWNKAIEEARGEFVYIATSDDAMDPECLERLAAALDRHPECGLAQGRLRVTEEDGTAVTDGLRWEEQPVPKFYLGALIDVPHVRVAPHDGLLHAATGTVFTSITQVMIRREVFARAGLFRTDLGPGADFEWGARSSLLFSTVYEPGAVATWRRHAAQVTSDALSARPENRRAMAAMWTGALQAAREAGGKLKAVDGVRLSRPLRHQAWLLERGLRPGPATVVRQWLAEPDLIGLDLRNLLAWRGRYHRCHLDFVRREMRRAGVAMPWADSRAR